MAGNRIKTISSWLGDIIDKLIKGLTCTPLETAYDLINVNKLSYVRIDNERKIRSWIK